MPIAESIPLRGARRVAPFVERIFEAYHRPERIGLDPLRWARAYDRREDREIAAFLAAALAYGNVKQIDRSLENLFGRLGRSPAAFARNFVPGRSEDALQGFYHRFNTARDLAALFHLLGEMLRGSGSLEAFWAQAQNGAPKGGDIADRAGRFIAAGLALDPGPYGEVIGRPAKLPFLYLMARADGPSACKRLNLFLRWVVRPDDGIDLGLWRIEKPADLQFPVDTHIGRISRYLGATRRKDATARTRREITAFFSRIDPSDPVRFDFSLCRIGILKHCPPQRDESRCRECELKAVCSRHRRMEREALKKSPAAAPGP